MYEGIEILEELQKHPNMKIHKEVVKIVDKYFMVEE